MCLHTKEPCIGFGPFFHPLFISTHACKCVEMLQDSCEEHENEVLQRCQERLHLFSSAFRAPDLTSKPLNSWSTSVGAWKEVKTHEILNRNHENREISLDFEGTSMTFKVWTPAFLVTPSSSSRSKTYTTHSTSDEPHVYYPHSTSYVVIKIPEKRIGKAFEWYI